MLLLCGMLPAARACLGFCAGAASHKLRGCQLSTKIDMHTQHRTYASRVSDQTDDLSAKAPEATHADVESISMPPSRARPSRIWVTAVSHPWRAVRVAAMTACYAAMLLRASALYRR
jgi:hypothetical protein